MARDHDHVVRCARRPALRAIAEFDLHVAHAGARQVGLREGRQLRVDLHRQHVLRLVREQGGHVARAGADLQHPLVRLDLQLLQEARLHLGRKHRLAAVVGAVRRGQAQRHLHVGERQLPVLRRHELLAPDHQQQVEHGLVEHLPGADLLLDHVVAGALDVQRGRGGGGTGGRGGAHRFSAPSTCLARTRPLVPTAAVPVASCRPKV